MKYNFDEIVPRRNSSSLKWDSTTNDDELPFWVADMDFRAAPPVLEALAKRVQHGVLGYTKAPQAYYDAVTSWFERRHGFTFQQEWTLNTTGVVPALSAIIKALTVPGDKVIVQPPVYNCFFSSVRNNGCEPLFNQLIYKDNTYTIDFDDLEVKSSDPQTKLLLLCSPHNPAGRVWSRDELTRIGEICLRNNVIVVSDEIHCDLVFQGYKHIPYASLGNDFLQYSVTCTAPSKTFNIAGLHTANIHAADKTIREKIDKTLNINELKNLNPFGSDALIAAYNDGEAWLDELKVYLYDNYLFLKDFFAKHLPQFPVIHPEATYLAWVDCTVLQQHSSVIAEKLLEKAGVRINPGAMYGPGGEHFIRINMACPRATLAEGLERVRQGIMIGS